jgi:hypothetical protein
MRSPLFTILLLLILAASGCDDTGFSIPEIKPFITSFGSGSNDEANSVQQTSDEGFIIAGRTLITSSVGAEGFIVKTTKEGTREWGLTFGGNDNDIFNSISLASGGYIAAGYTESFGAGGQDFYVVKTQANGFIEWSNTYGGSETEAARTIKQTLDGGFIAAGYTNTFGAGASDILVVKLSTAGAVEWSKAYGGSGNDAAFDILPIPDGGYIIAGETASFGVPNKDCYVIKINSSGDVLWSKTYGSAWADELNFVQSAESGYILSGATNLAGNYDMLLIKIDLAGNPAWSQTYGGSSHERSASVYPVSGGYITGGYTQSFGSGASDFFMLKVTTGGSLLWSKAYGGADNDAPGLLIPVSGGGFLGAGRTSSYSSGSGDIYLLKTDASGNSCLGGINAGTVVTSQSFSSLSPLTSAVSTGIIAGGAGTLQNSFPVSENLICR